MGQQLEPERFLLSGFLVQQGPKFREAVDKFSVHITRTEEKL